MPCRTNVCFHEAFDGQRFVDDGAVTQQAKRDPNARPVVPNLLDLAASLANISRALGRPHPLPTTLNVVRSSKNSNLRESIEAVLRGPPVGNHRARQYKTSLDWWNEVRAPRLCASTHAAELPLDQRRKEVRWRPGQEASLAPPCSNLRSFGSNILYWRKY